jgi:pimeloyl-ACP methyl ester carboxylesterase
MEIKPVKKARKYVIATAAALLMAALGTGVANAVTSNSSSNHRPPSNSGPYLAGFRQGMVSDGAGSLHYVIGGSGPALVLLHGWPETWWEWHDVMPSLAQSHTVIAFDLPGLGDSTIPSTGFDAATTATRIHAAVNALGFTSVELMGHDLGTLIAYDYARDYPQEVTRLAVLDSPLNGFGLESAETLSFHFLLNETAAPTPENIINNQLAEVTYLNFIFTFAYNPSGINRPVYYQAYASPANREAGYNYYRAFPANAADNTANASRTLTIPVLALGGQYSFGAGVGASFENVASDVHPVVVPNSGHFIPEEAPAFLSECAGLFFSSSANPVPPSSAYAGCVA